jgi:hypothetical protein
LGLDGQPSSKASGLFDLWKNENIIDPVTFDECKEAQL